MLIVRAVEDIPEQGLRKGDLLQFYIVDGHHHMGKEKTHRNMPSSAYEFYSMLWIELQKMAQQMREEDKLLFEPVDTRPTTAAQLIFESQDKWKRNSVGWLVDRTIAFPYTDDYSKSGFPKKASFRVSNDRIASWTTQAPHSARVIGFARVDPTDEVKGSPGLAVGELERAVKQLGLRGLKLHPLAQLFVDDLDSPAVIDVVATAGKLRIPVLFDARNIRTVQRIVALLNIIRDEGAIPPRTIVGHCGMSPASTALYNALSNPLVFGETSSLHDRDIPLLIQKAIKLVQDPYTSWSSKIIFGTDYSFLSVQAAELILYLLSRDFPGNVSDIQKILGGNALFLIRQPYRTNTGREDPKKQFIVQDSPSGVLPCVVKTIVDAIRSGRWSMTSLDYMIPPNGSWPHIQPIASGGDNGIDVESSIFSLRTPEGDQVHIWVHPQPGDMVSCAVIPFSDGGGIMSLESTSSGPDRRLVGELNRESQEFKTGAALCRALAEALS